VGVQANRYRAALACGAQGRKRSFLKKRTKRLLRPAASHLAGQVPDLATRAEAKVFWFFFSKKNF
jgi:hypothetical protein